MTPFIINIIIVIIVYIIAYRDGEKDAENRILKTLVKETGIYLEKK